MLTLDPASMRLRRISKKVFNFYFPGAGVDELAKCPFCQQGRSFYIARQGFEPKILTGVCRDIVCSFKGDARRLIQRWHGLEAGYVDRVLEAFDAGSSDKKIAELIVDCVNQQHEANKNKFLT